MSKQPDHDRPRHSVLLEVDKKLAKDRVAGLAQNSPIRAARSKSGSIKMWSNSAEQPAGTRRDDDEGDTPAQGSSARLTR
jgi:hypothetical protein